MDFISLLFLAAALAMDAFSVSVTDGLVIKNFKLADAAKVGLFFGAFQFIMPCIGNFLASFATDYIEKFDHWIAFILLAFLGVRMIWEAIRGEDEIPQNPLRLSTLFLMAVATSIDALAAGVSLAAVNAPIIYSSAVIGIVAFVFSFFGMYAGRRFGDLLGNKAEILGGAVLIFIGTKTLIEHLLGR